MIDHIRERDDDGLSERDLVETTCKAYQCAMGETEPNWPPDDDMHSAWAETIAHMNQMLEDGVKDMPFKDLARIAYMCFATRMNVNVPFEDANQKTQLAFESTVRHLVHAYDFDRNTDVAAFEHEWRDWVQKKLQQREQVCQPQ